MDSYHDDMDSGYQEPHEVTGSLRRSPMRAMASSPTAHDISNISAGGVANGHGIHYSSSNQTGNAMSISRKTTLSRRISDASSHNGTSM